MLTLAFARIEILRIRTRRRLTVRMCVCQFHRRRWRRVRPPSPTIATTTTTHCRILIIRGRCLQRRRRPPRGLAEQPASAGRTLTATPNSASRACGCTTAAGRDSACATRWLEDPRRRRATATAGGARGTSAAEMRIYPAATVTAWRRVCSSATN